MPPVDPVVEGTGSSAPRRARPTAALGEVGRSAVILTGAQVGVQAVGIIRQIILASRVGISSELDALIIGLTLPTTLSLVLLSGTRVALVPAYFEAKSDHGRRDAQRFAGMVLLWVSVISVIITLGLYAFAGPLATLTGPGLNSVAHDQTTTYLRLLAPLAFLGSATGILLAVSQAEQRFRLIAVTTFAGPFVTLIVMLALWDQLGLQALAIGSLIGPVVALVMLGVGMLRVHILPGLHLRAGGLGGSAFARHATPLTLSAVILQLNTIGDNAIASLLAPGAVSALRYADSLIRLPVSAVQNAWGTAVYPALVKATRGMGATALAPTTMLALRYVIAIFVPLAALTAAVAPVAVDVAYGWGAFTPAELILTAQIMAGFAPLMVVLMVVPIFTGAFNARRNGVILLIGGVTNVTLNLVLDVILGWSMGVVGVAFASSIAQSAVVIMWARRFQRDEPEFRSRELMHVLARSIAAAAPSALVIGGIVWTGHLAYGELGGLVILLIAGIAGLASYVWAAARLGITEPLALWWTAIGAVRQRLHVRNAA